MAENTQQPLPESPLVFDESPITSETKQDRRLSDEWDAAKVPPSRFQKRKGSIYATPSSRDGHVDKNYAERYHAKIAEKYSGTSKRRNS